VQRLFLVFFLPIFLFFSIFSQFFISFSLHFYVGTISAKWFFRTASFDFGIFQAIYILNKKKLTQSPRKITGNVLFYIGGGERGYIRGEGEGAAFIISFYSMKKYSKVQKL